jgi:hypothetical protein
VRNTKTRLSPSHSDISTTRRATKKPIKLLQSHGDSAQDVLLDGAKGPLGAACNTTSERLTNFKADSRERRYRTRYVHVPFTFHTCCFLRTPEMAKISTHRLLHIIGPHPSGTRFRPRPRPAAITSPAASSVVQHENISGDFGEDREMATTGWNPWSPQA